jgi:hypothetical protein
MVAENADATTARIFSGFLGARSDLKTGSLLSKTPQKSAMIDFICTGSPSLSLPHCQANFFLTPKSKTTSWLRNLVE